MLTVTTFRGMVRAFYPHVKIAVRTVDFTDLARAKVKALTVVGERDRVELYCINKWAKEAGILPDNNIRCYPEKEVRDVG